MSPPGVVMTYLALDDETALAETMPPSTEPSPSTTYALGEFALTREVNVLDLTRVPSIPSIFDLERASEREAVLFLRAFERDVSKPIDRDDRVHVEYIPTQVVTEYVRVAPQLRAAGVRGMKYRSARRKGGVNLVLFGGRELVELSATEREELAPFEREQGSRQEPCLRLTTTSERTI